MALYSGELALGVAAVLTALGWAVTRRMARPLQALERRMRTLADGELEQEVPGADRRDEIGLMAQAVCVFREHALRVLHLEREQEAVQARPRQSGRPPWDSS